MQANRALLMVVTIMLASAANAAPLPTLIGAVTPSSSVAGAPTTTKDLAADFIVTPDVALFRDTAAHLTPGIDTRMRLELATDVAYDAHVVRAERAENGAVSLSLTLDGQPLGMAVLTEREGHVYGRVSMPGAAYLLKSRADGAQIVQRIDERVYPNERPAARIHGAAPAAQDLGAADVPTDTGRMIDVMIVWDAAATTANGSGDPGMQTLAANAVALANSAYANSGIAQRLRLVYSGAVTYTQRTSGGCSDVFDCALNDITNDTITVPSKLSVLRDANGADLVTLLVSDTAFCGVAWLPNTISSGNSGDGFSVVDAGCAVGNLSYPHELAHNMGADHDAANATPGDGPRPYNEGYYNATNRWRTVMAYPDPCFTDAGNKNCTRLPWFSNPDYTVDYDGAGGQPAITMGNASTENNAMILNLTAKAVAGYRATAASHPISASFIDMPLGNSQFGAVEFMKQAQITSGCTANTYCPAAAITRRQMAVFLERARRNSLYVPPAATGIFSDVAPASQFAGFIEALSADGITQGCSPGDYCPEDPVNRAQMAIFILRASCGSSYVPAAATGTIFADVSTSTPGAAYIEKIYRLGGATGCATGPLRYCPADALTRGQMAVFMERSFPFLAPSEACTP